MKKTTWLQILGIALLGGTAGRALAEDVNAGPIWNQADANNKCPGVCSGHTGEHWNGQWRTTVPNKMSVCGCEPVKPPPPPAGGNKVAKEAGPIWNQADANNKCPRVCAAPAKWDGQWWTTVPNKMSVCECETPRAQDLRQGSRPHLEPGRRHQQVPARPARRR